MPVETPPVADTAAASPWQRAPVEGRWRATVFAPRGDGVRARLGSDAWRLAACVVALGLVVYAFANNASIQRWLVQQTVPPPRGVTWLLTLLALAGTFGVSLLLLVSSVLSRRREVLIDVIGAACLSVAGAVGLGWLFSAMGIDASAEYPGIDATIPLVTVTASVGIVLAARPYLARPFQRLCYVALAFGAVCTVCGARGLPLSVLASLLVGWASAVTMRLITGTPSGLPSASDVGAMLEELGVRGMRVEALDNQSWGAARYNATSERGDRLRVSIYGRDARDAQLAASIGRSIAYRDEGQPLFVTRIQQAEHEAYVTLRARASVGRAATELVATGRAGPSRDGVVITRRAAGRSLRELLEGDGAPEGASERLLGAVAALARESLSHGSIDPDHVFVLDDGTVVLDDFLRGTSAASTQRAARDLASAITCSALLIGPDRAISLALEVVGRDGVISALPYLQPAALPGALASVVKSRDDVLEPLRTGGAAALSVDPPELAKLTRVSGTTIIFAVGTLIGGWALIGVLLDVANSFSTIRGAEMVWVGAVAVLAASCYPCSAMICEGSIPDRLPYWRLVILEVSNTFSSLAVGTVAVLGARVRFFQKQGLDATTAVSSGVLASSVSWIVKGALFLIAIPFALSSFDFSAETSSGSGNDHAIWVVLVIVCVIGVALGVALFVPRIRSVIKKKLAPKAGEIRQHLKTLAEHPRKLVMVIGGCVAVQLLVAYALGASLHAFGESLSVAQLLIVLTLGSVLGGISPVPGGMGVVEAGMIIGLTSVGIPEDIAVSAVFVQRLFTAYLPPIGGWFALAWLRRQELL